MKKKHLLQIFTSCMMIMFFSAAKAQEYDLVIVNGTIVVKESKVLKGVYSGKPIRNSTH